MAVCWREMQPTPVRCHLRAPSRHPTRPRPRGGGVSAGGLKAPSFTPPHLPVPLAPTRGWGWGGRLSGTVHSQSRRPGGLPFSTPSSVSPTRTDRSAPKAPGPAPRLRASASSNTHPAPPRVGSFGPRRGGRPGWRWRLPGKVPGPSFLRCPGCSPLRAPQYLCPVADSALPPW